MTKTKKRLIDIRCPECKHYIASCIGELESKCRYCKTVFIVVATLPAQIEFAEVVPGVKKKAPP